jgi:hypothetical protein
MMLGWAAGKFGMFGLPPEPIVIDWLSYVGVALGAVAIVLFAFVEPRKMPRRSNVPDDTTSMLDETESEYAEITRGPFMPKQEKPRTLKSVFGPTGSRVLGVFLAIVAGVFFGVNFVPPEYLMTHYSARSITDIQKYSNNGLDYVFSHFFGIFITAGGFMVIFRTTERFWGDGMPTFFTAVIVEEQTLPGFLCGIGWAVGQTAWFIANTNIGLVAAFPIITLAPGVIATLWSIFLFKEISGAKNFTLVVLAFIVVGMSCACTVIAKRGI